MSAFFRTSSLHFMRFTVSPVDALRWRRGGQEGARVRIWFWGWLVAAVAIAALSAVQHDRTSVPFAVGAGMAAALEAAGLDPTLEWLVFAGVSAAAFILLNYAGHRPRHSRRGLGRHGTGANHDDESASAR
jgi:amino acid transporter